MLAVVGGERPPRPTHPTLTDDLWALIQQCWDKDARLRPRMLQILRGLWVSIPELHMRSPDLLLASRTIPAWKRLTDRPLDVNERIPLIADIFSDRSEIEAVRRLRGNDAQSFVDVVDEVFLSFGLQEYAR